MKAHRILLLCSALALPQLAMAGLADTNPQGLAIVQAVLKFCSQLDPRDAPAFQQEWNSIVGDGTEKQLDGIEAAGGYQQASDSTTHLLDKLPRSAATAYCLQAAAQWRGQSALGKVRDELPQEGKHGNTGVHAPELK